MFSPLMHTDSRTGRFSGPELAVLPPAAERARSAAEDVSEPFRQRPQAHIVRGEDLEREV